MLKLVLPSLALVLVNAAQGSIVTLRCRVLFAKFSQEGGDFAKALSQEKDRDVRNYALIIRADVLNHGAMTEIGAHGKGLSWKWLGVSAEEEPGGLKHKVVGYANFQHYMEPYAELAREGKIPQIAVGSTMKNEVFIDGKEFGKLPLRVRQKIIRAIRLALKPKRVRVFQAEEAEQLFREGTLPQVGGALSMVGNVEDDAGVSLLSLAPRRDSGADAAKAEFLIDPTQPIIIGRQGGGVPDYLDPNYESTDLAPGGQAVLGREQDGSVSRAHLMLEGVVGKGIRVVNGVPSSEGAGIIRAPTNETWIALPGKGERLMTAKEAVLIPLGSWAIVRLPNGAQFRIDAKR